MINIEEIRRKPRHGSEKSSTNQPATGETYDGSTRKASSTLSTGPWSSAPAIQRYYGRRHQQDEPLHSMATQGLSNYLKHAANPSSIKVAIAYDCRNNSSYFAKVAADIFTANGFTAYLFESLRPTPELSYAIRLYGCDAGVIITASHNPKEYNGYKVSWNDGGQVVSPHDRGIINEVRSIRSVTEIAGGGDP